MAENAKFYKNRFLTQTTPEKVDILYIEDVVIILQPMQWKLKRKIDLCTDDGEVHMCCFQLCCHSNTQKPCS